MILLSLQEDYYGIYLFNTDIPQTELHNFRADTAGDGSDYNMGYVINTNQNTAKIDYKKTKIYSQISYIVWVRCIMMPARQ